MLFNMDFLWEVTLLGLIAGVIGTGGGGLFAYFLKRPSNKILSTILGFSSGIMLMVIFLELLLEAFEIGYFLYPMVGLILGIIVLLTMDVHFPHHHFISEEKQSRFLKVGVLLGIGIALHNVPEGLAIGAGYASNVDLGAGLTLIMAVQNVPEGIAMSTTLTIAGLKPWRNVISTCIAGLPMGIGSFLGALIGSISPEFLSISLGFAAGAMLYIVADELIPDAHELASGHTATLGIVVGVVVGLLLSAL